MKYTLKYIIVLLLIILQLPKFCISQQNSKNEAKIIVESEYKKWLNSIPKGYIENYGFPATDCFDSIKIGQAIPIFIHISESKTETVYLELNKLYLVPVIYKSQFACFIKVLEESNDIRIIGIGGHNYAKSIFQCCNENNMDLQKGNVAILQLSGLNEHYIFENQKSHKKEKFYIIKNTHSESKGDIEKYVNFDKISAKIANYNKLKTNKYELD